MKSPSWEKCVLGPETHNDVCDTKHLQTLARHFQRLRRLQTDTISCLLTANYTFILDVACSRLGPGFPRSLRGSKSESLRIQSFKISNKNAHSTGQCNSYTTENVVRFYVTLQFIQRCVQVCIMKPACPFRSLLFTLTIDWLQPGTHVRFDASSEIFGNYTCFRHRRHVWGHRLIPRKLHAPPMTSSSIWST